VRLIIIPTCNLNTVKLRYNRLGHNRYSVNTDFFSGPGSVSMRDNTVRMDSVITDFHLLQTRFMVPTLRTDMLDTMD